MNVLKRPRGWAAVLLAMSIVSCSGRRPAPEPSALTPPPPLSAVCEAADFASSGLCTDASCVEGTLGDQCLSCVSETYACAEGDAACVATCERCLGAELCALPSNISHAHRLSVPAEPEPGWRVRRRGVVSFTGASADGSRVAVIADKGRRHLVVDRDDRVVWEPRLDGKCTSPAVSRGGRWFASYCDTKLRLYELSTGFLRHEFGVRRLAEDEYLSWDPREGIRHLIAERHVLLPQEDKWTVHGADSEPWVVPFEKGVPVGRVALSWDGTTVAMARDNVVSFYRSDGTKTQHALDPESEPQSVAFEADGRLMHLSTDMVASRIDPASGVVEQQEFEHAGVEFAPSAQGPVFWKVDYQAEERVDVAAFGQDWTTLDLAGDVPVDDLGLHHNEPLLAGLQQLEDGRFIVGAKALGIMTFLPGGVLESGREAGPVKWLVRGQNNDVVVGYSSQTRRLDLESGIWADVVNTPPDLVPQWFGETMLAVEQTDFGDTLRDEPTTILLSGDISAKWTVGGEEVVSSATYVDGRVFVATSRDIRSYDPAAPATHRVELEFKEGADADFSIDGAFAAVMEKDTGTRVYRTADFSNPIAEVVGDCAMSSAGLVIACNVVDEKVGRATLTTRSLPDLTVLHEFSAEAAQPLLAQMLRLVFRPMDASADGEMVATGLLGPEWIAVVHLPTRRLTQIEGVAAWSDSGVVRLGESHLQAVDPRSEFDLELPSVLE